MGDNGEVELDVQETLRAILHTQARMEIQLQLIVDGLRTIMVSQGIQEKLEKIARDLDEVTPVEIHTALMGIRGGRDGR